MAAISSSVADAYFKVGLVIEAGGIVVTAQMPSTIVDNARPGDVVLTMGAGSIGAVPAKVVQLLAKDKLETHIGRGL